MARERSGRGHGREGGGVRFRHWLTGEMMGQRYAPGSQADTIADPAPKVRKGNEWLNVPPLNTSPFAAFERQRAAFIYRGVGPG